MDVQFDWKSWLTPWMAKLGGWSKTQHNIGSVSAFRVWRNPTTGIVETRWKTSASLSTDWLGADGTAQGAG
jgi:hypothetical protein